MRNRCRSLGMTRVFSPSPVPRRPTPAVACRLSPVACRLNYGFVASLTISSIAPVIFVSSCS